MCARTESSVYLRTSMQTPKPVHYLRIAAERELYRRAHQVSIEVRETNDRAAVRARRVNAEKKRTHSSSGVSIVRSKYGHD